MKRIASGNWVLINTDGQPVSEGLVTNSFRDEPHIISGGRPPQHSGSQGKVYARMWADDPDREYFPNVFNLKWVESEEFEAINERQI